MVIAYIDANRFIDIANKKATITHKCSLHVNFVSSFKFWKHFMIITNFVLDLIAFHMMTKYNFTGLRFLSYTYSRKIKYLKEVILKVNGYSLRLKKINNNNEKVDLLHLNWLN